MIRLVKAFLIWLIHCYQLVLAPCIPDVCRFTPTCSHYFIEALQKRGLVIGFLLGVYRILRCNPFCRSGYDPVPEKTGPARKAGDKEVLPTNEARENS